MEQTIKIKSFNGIGDLLFVTPALQIIKQVYPNHTLVVNTNRPSLLKHNPYVDVIGSKNEGVFLGYDAPDTGRQPTCHHIITDWKIVREHYGLDILPPSELRPQLFIKNLPDKRDIIGVQSHHKRNYHDKRVWPHFKELSRQEGFEAIPMIKTGDKMIGLVKKIASYKKVICAEGGISHIAAALRMPAVVLMGGFTNPIWTGYDDHVNLCSVVDCKYCFNLNPCKHNFKCWKQFSLEYVRSISL